MRGVFISLLCIGACAHAPTSLVFDKDPSTEDPDGSSPSLGEADSSADDVEDARADDVTEPSPDSGNDAGNEAGNDAGNDAAPVLDAGQDSGPVQTSVNLSWNGLPSGFTFSLSVQTGAGEWITPCLGPPLLGASASVVYDGVCKSYGNRAVANPAGYRLYFSNNGYWVDYVEASGTGDSVVFANPTMAATTVPVSWNKKSNTAEYSLDVVVGSEVVGPCVDVNTIHKSLSYAFKGTCVSAGNRNVDIASITEFRICWAENNDWGHAQCKGVPFNGLGRSAVILN